MLLNNLYYTLKLFTPRWLQIQLRRYLVRRKLPNYESIWPIDPQAATPPEGWGGWPDGKKFALVLTHDVESAKGLDRCYLLAEIEERLGFRSSFNFVAGDYELPGALHQYLTSHGFEIAVHGLYHDKNPFRTEAAFLKQSVIINRCLKEWGAVGFRSPSMYHDLELLHHLDIEYDTSTFDTDPFEPQPDSLGTIFPVWIPNRDRRKGYLELPYTLPQDFLMFVLLQEKTLDIWKKKLDWIAEHGGMALFITHPDYVSVEGRPRYDQYPVKHYEEFLNHIKTKYEGVYWNALPKGVSSFWASRHRPAGASNRLPHILPAGSPQPEVREPSTAATAATIDPVSDPRWDHFVETHPFGLICHLSGWKQVLEESFSHMKGHYITLLNQDGSIRAAMPLFEVSSILTGKRLVSIPFATICDPLISSNEDMMELLDAAINLSRDLGCSKIEIRALAAEPLIDDYRTCRVIQNKTHQLLLEPDLDRLMSKFSRQVRRKLKKPLPDSVETQLAGNVVEFQEFYRLYVETRKRLGLPPQPYLFFESLWKHFSAGKHTTVLLIRHKGKLVAGLMMFHFKDRCSCEYLAADADFKKRNVDTDYFIYWEAIRFAHSAGYKLFDFGRTGINNAGLMTFKNLWGTNALDLPQFYYPRRLGTNVGSPDESIPYILIRQISKKVPDELFQAMGNIIYRHLG